MGHKGWQADLPYKAGTHGTVTVFSRHSQLGAKENVVDFILASCRE